MPTCWKVAFVGLGVMGYPMAGHLAAKGHDVIVYNRTAKKALDWAREFGGLCAETPAQAAKGRDFIFVCVGNDNDVRSVTHGADGIFSGMAEGAILIDHTTDSADLARELCAKASEISVGFIDAPVSGGQAGAENGQLTIMCGGDQKVFDRVSPVMDLYAQAVTLMGPAGAGQLTKMVNQICIAGVLQGLSEGMNFALKARLDCDKVVDVISKGAAGSWQMANRGRTMVRDEFDFGFAVDWMRKDLGIALAEAGRNGSCLASTALIDQFYAQVQSRGGGRWDTSSLIQLLRYQ